MAPGSDLYECFLEVIILETWVPRNQAAKLQQGKNTELSGESWKLNSRRLLSPVPRLIGEKATELV